MRHVIVARARLVLAAACLVASGSAAQGPPRPPLSVRRAVGKKVLVIGIDGARIDVIRALHLPNIERLAANGMLSEAQARMPTVSGPGWSSILIGVWSDKHGVKDNHFVGKNYARYPDFLTRLERLDSTWSTFAAVDWPPLGSTIDNGPLVGDSVDVKVLVNGDRLGYPAADARSVAAAARYLASEDPDAAFVYIGNPDEVAHKVGALTPEYRASLREADRLVGRLVSAVHSRPTYAREDWLILMSTDHGHVDKGGHGGDSPVELRSFFLASGRSASHARPTEQVDIVDVAVTALTHLGVAIDPAWGLDGKVVGLRR